MLNNFKIGTGPRSAVVNVSDCSFRGPKFDPGSIPYSCGDEREIIFMAILLPSTGLLSVTSESMFANYRLTACSSLPRKKCG